MFRTFFSRLIGVFQSRRMDREFDEETRLHLDMLTDRFIAQGMSPEEARYAAMRQFGGVSRAQQELRDIRALPVLDIIARDFSRAFRELRRAKGLTTTAVLTLAVGIGASIAVFAVLDAVVLRPLPFAEPDRLMGFRTLDNRGIPRQLSYPDFFDYREQNDVFEHVASYREGDFTLTDSRPPIQVPGQIVSWDLFDLLGVRLSLGRGFLPEEEQPGRHAVVLSHSIWRNRFGADRGIGGRPISINGNPFTVVGVAPAGFRFPVEAPDVELWVTISEDASARGQRGARMIDAIGRLKPGVSASQARSRLDVIAAALAQKYKEFRTPAKTSVVPELERVAGTSRSALFVLFGAVAMLLLIACANVANLLLARNAERARDFAVQTALGATRTAIVRQVLIEGVVLGFLGAAGGLLVARSIVRTLLPMVIESIPRVYETKIDERVLAFAIALAMLTSVLFSLAPAFRATGARPAEVLKARAQNIARGRDRFRSCLVVLQVTLGLILLFGAELFTAGFLHLVRLDPGFRPDHLLTFNVGFSESQSGVSRQIAFTDRLLARLSAMPGAESVAMGRPLPLQGHQMTIAFDIEGQQTPPSNRPRSDAAIVTPAFFSAMGIPVLKGRDFTDRDSTDSTPVVIVNQTFARKFFPQGDAMGKRIQPGAGERPVMREIIGIVGDARQAPLGTDADPVYYFPYKQLPWGLGTVVLRTTSPPSQMDAAVRAAVADVDLLVPIYQVRTGEQLAAAVLATIQFLVLLMGGFAGMALLLTITGLYGVLSYAVERRRREIGVRIVLGAGRVEVLGLVLRHAIRLVAIGIVLGITGAAAVTRLLRAALPGVQSVDPALLIAACCAFLLATLAAAYRPAARAANVDPIRTLRTE